jgi:tetratricopeptide (TPR) repeat protein
MKNYFLFGLSILLTFHPFRLEAQDLQADTLFRLLMKRDYPAVIRQGQILCDKDSTDPNLYYVLGIASGNLKQYPQAARYLGKSLALDPDNKPAALDLADCYCELARPEAAERLLKDLLQKDTTDTQVRLELARVYLQESNSPDAIGIYYQLWKEDTLNLWYPRQIGMILSKNNLYKEAIPYLEKVVGSDSLDMGSYLRLGQAYINLNKPDKIPVLDKAIRQDSTEALLYRYRGGLEMMAGQYETAGIDLSKALALGDTSAFTCRHLGISLYQQSEYQEALPPLIQATLLDSTDTEAWYYMGFCYKWTEDIPKGIECLQKALEIGIPPSIGAIYSGLGMFNHILGNFKVAKRNYLKALEYNPADPVPLSQLGVIEEETFGDRELAKKYYEQFLNEYTGPDKNLINYVTDRIRIIKEKLFMEGKLK